MPAKHKNRSRRTVNMPSPPSPLRLVSIASVAWKPAQEKAYRRQETRLEGQTSFRSGQRTRGDGYGYGEAALRWDDGRRYEGQASRGRLGRRQRPSHRHKIHSTEST